MCSFRSDDFYLGLLTKLPFSVGDLKDVVKENPYLATWKCLCRIKIFYEGVNARDKYERTHFIHSNKKI